ncbi:hypothetical protein J0S82_011149, partial [Galemys pyrenaicus]
TSSKGIACFGCSMLEHPQVLTPSGRARSLDNCPSSASRARSPESPVQSTEAQFSTATTPSVEASRELLQCEQSTPQDAKKDKAQKRAQQGWLKSVLNFFLRSGPEEPKEKADRTKVKEGVPQVTETPAVPGQPVLRKKSHDKKASRKKRSYKKPVAEEITVVQDQEAEGQEAGPPRVAAAHGSKKEANLGPSGREKSLVSTNLRSSSARALASRRLLPKAPVISWKSRPESLTNGAGAADASNLESQPASRPRFLPLRVGVYQHPISSSSGEQSTVVTTTLHLVLAETLPRAISRAAIPVLSFTPTISFSSSGAEESEVQEAMTTEGGGLSPSESHPAAGGQEPEEDLPLDRGQSLTRCVSSYPQGFQDPQPEVVPQKPAPAARKKSQERKSTLKRVFSSKKHGPEEPKKVGAMGAASPESRPLKRPNFLPLCVGGHRPSFSSTYGEQAGVAITQLICAEESEVQEAMTTEGGGLSPSESHPAAGGQEPEEDLPLDRVSESKDAIIQMIVDFLKKVGDQYEKEGLQDPQPEVVPQKPAPAARKKSQERKSTLKRAFSSKKHGPEEPKKVGAMGAASPESRPLKRPSFLPLCVGGHRPSFSSTADSEAAGGLGRREKNETSGQAEGAVKSSGVRLVQRGSGGVREEPGDQDPSVPALPDSFLSEPRVSVWWACGLEISANRSQPTPFCSQIQSWGFSSSRSPCLQKGCEQEPQKQPPSPEASRQKGTLSRMEQEQIFQKLMAILQEVGEQLKDQIRRNPGLKKYFREIVDASLEKLVTSPQTQEAHSTELNRSLMERPYQFPLGLPNNGLNVISLMDFTGHSKRRYSGSHFSCREALQ